MTPEAADYVVKAQGDLSDARKVFAIGLATMAARAAYYAAEAFIIERTGKVAKSHSGVRNRTMLVDWSCCPPFPRRVK